MVHSQLHEYLNSTNLLSNNQFGFRSKRSTATALSSFADEVLLHMEKGHICGAVFLDLTKAFAGHGGSWDLDDQVVIYLGIMLASDFTWSDHVEYVISKVNQRLALLRRIKHLLPFTSRLLFYKSLVLPVFDYDDLVRGDKNNVTLMNDLQVLQNKAAKTILDSY